MDEQRPKKRPRVPLWKQQQTSRPRKKYPKGYYGTRDVAKMLDARLITLGRVVRACHELAMSQSQPAAALLSRVEKLVTKFERLQMGKEDSR